MKGCKNPEKRATKTDIQETKKAAAVQPLFLNGREIAQYLNVSENKARKILAQNGVRPVDLGKGRGNGLRWRTSAVIEVADILHTEAQAKKTQQRVKKSPYTIRGKSAADLFAEFNGCAPLKAEVCNGN